MVRRTFPQRSASFRWKGLRAECRQRRQRLLRLEWLEPRRVLDALGAAAYNAVSAEWFAAVPQIVAGVEDAPAVDSTGVFGPIQADRPAQATRWIVRLTEQATAAAGAVQPAEHLLDTLAADFQVLRGLGLPGQLLVRSFAPDEIARTALAANPQVAAFGPERAVLGPQGDPPDDPLFGQQWALENTGQTGGTPDADIDALGAWDVATGSIQVVVGVVDSGVDYTHPDLYLNVGINQGEIPDPFASQIAQIDVDGDGLVTFYDLNDPDNAGLVAERADDGNDYIDGGDVLQAWSDGADTDGNGYRDDLIGWDFQGNDNNPRDEHRHGTHVAGTIAALGNNGLGIAGINRAASLLPLKFLDANNQGFLSDAVAAVNYATLMRTTYGMNVRVTNNSWVSGTEPDEGLRDAIEAAGAADILFVAAAGNGDILGRGIDLDADPYYPAAYDLDNILSVAATDRNDKLARFSNYGLQSVDIAAPGVAILSTEPGGQYGSRNGTSMAAPHVTGVAALVWSRVPYATMSEVRAAILQGADPITGLQSKIASGRRLNAHGALLVDTAAPLAQLVGSPDVTGPGLTHVDVTVQYTDDQAVDQSTLGATDLVVTRIWDGVEMTGVTLQSSQVQGGGRTVTAVYRVPAPDGTWGAEDQGDYRISLRAGEVFDTVYNAARAAELGTFNVDTTEGLFRADSLLDAPDAAPGDGVSDDGSGHSTLRAAVMESNASLAQENTIRLRPGKYTLSIGGAGEDLATAADLDITHTLTIRGAGADRTTIDAAGLERVFHVHPGATLTLRDVSLTGGLADSGGAIRVELGATFTATAVGLYSNQATTGGAVSNLGTLTIEQSALYDNVATDRAGALDNAGHAQLTNTTVSGNQTTAAGSSGGGVFNAPAATATLIHCTVADNQADASGGGIQNEGTARPINTLIATNTAPAGPDVLGAFAPDGVNLVGNSAGSAGWQPADLLDIDPRLGPLQDNTGSTPTHALLAGSPAIDAAENAVAPTVDQRGIPRPQDADLDDLPQVDMGAFEKYYAAIHGVRYHDLDEDDERDPDEPGLAGWTMYLDTNGDSKWNPGEPTTETRDDDPGTPEVDEAGNYTFTLLQPGDYLVGEVLPAGWKQTHASYGTQIEIASVAKWQLAANDSTFDVSVSAAGRHVAFNSFASDLVEGDTNVAADIFVYDRQTGIIERVSVAGDGTQGNASSWHPSISGDGRYVAFRSDASNLVPGDTNGAPDLFIYDRATQTIERVEVDLDQIVGSDHRLHPSISGDGRYVAFGSFDFDLAVPWDFNFKDDIFVYDRQTQTMEQISVASGGEETDADSAAPSMSGNGRYVAFQSDASNLLAGDTNGTSDVFVYDRQTDVIERISVANEGTQGNGGSRAPSLSADGRYVSFESDASNLVPGDTNGVADVFLYDRQTQTVERISAADGGIQADDASSEPSLSADGRYVAFLSEASNLVSGDSNGHRDVFVYDRATGVTDRVNVAADGTQADQNSLFPSVSGDGRCVAFITAASNLVPGDFARSSGDVLVHDREHATLERITNGPDRTTEPADDHSLSPAVSADGRYVAFYSLATNLAMNDDNNDADVFVYDRQTQELQTVSVTGDGTPGNGASWGPDLSADGRCVAFTSVASDFVPGEVNDSFHIYVFDRGAQTVERVSVADDGTQADGNSEVPSLTADGRYVAFHSFASNLVPGDSNAAPDVFVYDRDTHTIARVSIAASGSQGNSNSGMAAISDDGRYVAFQSWASNFVPGDSNGKSDVFVYDRHTQTIERVSVNSAGTQGNGDSQTPDLSEDGRYVVFTSSASNLVPGDTNGADDIFVYDRQTRVVERVSVDGDGTQGNNTSGGPTIAADGRYVAFASHASNLVPADNNGMLDIFVYDRMTRTPEQVSVADDGTLANSHSGEPAISGDGRSVAFRSAASNLVASDTLPQADIYVAATPGARLPWLYRADLEAGQQRTGVDFGNHPLDGEIRGTLFQDLNTNGHRENAEPALVNWQVFLDHNGNGTVDGDEATVQTNAFGELAFENVASLARYAVVAVANQYWIQTTPRPADGGAWDVWLDAGELRTGVDFGFQYRGPTGQGADGISGRLFRDLDGNGRQDAGETGMAGQTVYVDVNNDGVLDGGDIPALTQADNPATAEVDETGRYSFEGLARGTYTVRVVPASGSTQTTPLDPQLSALHYGTGILDQSQAVAAGDLDSDGDSDLVVAHGNYVSWLANDGTGLFAAPVPIPAYDGVAAWSLAVEDLDEDGDRDLAVANYLSSNVSVLLNDGQAHFTLQGNHALGVYPHAVSAGDFDRDGDTDLAVALEWDGKVAVLRNDGQGSFSLDTTKPLSGTNPFDVVSGQFNDDNADGRIDHLDAPDLVLANFGSPQSSTDLGSVAVLLNNGSGQFSTRVTVPAGDNPASVAAADFDLDGDQDLAVANFGSNSVAILVNLGNGSFVRLPDLFPAGAGPYALTAGDLDHDRDPDLVVTNGTDDHLAVLRNDSASGDIWFAAPQSVGVANFPDSLSFGVAVQDLNDDGDLDLAVANGTGNNVSVMLNQVVQGAHRVTLNGLDTFTALDFGLQPDNAPPTISALDDRTTPEGRTVGPLSLTIGDLETPAGELLVVAASDNFTLVPIANLVLAGSGSQRTLTVTPAANQTGLATITVSVSDGIHTVSESFQLTVTPMMTVTSFAATRTGFTAQLNHGVVASVLNLYDQGGALGPADVAVTGATVGPVRGSLVVDPGLRKITFIKTGGPLEVDTYTVTLFSGANAFRDAEGNLLDGNGDGTAGDNFTASFVVATAPDNQVTVRLPDFARGYGQPVNLPANDLAAGLPLQLSDGLGVSRLQLTLRYDPSLLEVPAFMLSSSLVGREALAEFDVESPGEVTLDITAPSGFAEASGPLTVGTFTAAVPATALYGAKHVLDIAELHVFDTAGVPAELPAADDDAIHVAAFFGDNNGSRTYNAPDVTLNQRLIGLINTGFSAYQLADPLLLADITRNGQMQANDTVSIQRLIGQVPVANVPPLPTFPPGFMPPAPSGADPRIYIPQDLAGSPGDTVTVPVRMHVTEPAGITLSGFDVVIEYDPARLTVTDAQIGPLLTGMGFVGSRLQLAPGVLIYTAGSGKPPEQLPVLPLDQNGDIVTLTVTIPEGAAPGPAAVNLRASYTGTDTRTTAAFDRDLNDLVLTPPPTNGPDDSVDGLLNVIAVARLDVPQDLSGRRGESVTVPVRMTVTEPEGTTISGFDVVARYDPTRFTLASAQLGTLFSGADFQVSEPIAGTVICTAASGGGTTLLPLDTQADLFTLSLTVNTEAPLGVSPINLLESSGGTTTALYNNDLDTLSLYPPPTDGPSDSVDGLVNVEDALTLIVTRLTPTTAGFVAAFNRELGTSSLNLYDGAGGELGPSDAILQDGSGNPVPGSLVLAGDLHTVEFVKTGSPLAPGNYTVLLKSGSTAFRDATGNLLDGNRDGTPGDDFTLPLTVAAVDQRVLSVPDFARGAGQPVHVPASATGLPVRISSADAVTSVAVDVVFDPALLQITAAALAAGVPGDWSVTRFDTSTAGVAKLTAAGTTPLSGSDVEIVRLAAAVPNAAPYGASQAIQLENIAVNGGALAAAGDVAVHKAAYLGDADGSGIHSSADAFLTVQAALGLASGFVAHAWTDPRIVGDADGSGVLSAADAFLIVQEGLGLAEPFVPDNPHITVTPVSGGVDPRFQIAVDIPATVGGWVTVPVQLDIEPAATNVGAIEFEIFFDPSRLTIAVPEGILAGADTADHWAISATSVAAGHVRVSMLNSRGEVLAAGLREIARLVFRVDAAATEGVATVDIEPWDVRAGGLVWTDSDGSLWISPALPAGGDEPADRLEVSGETRVHEAALCRLLDEQDEQRGTREEDGEQADEWFWELLAEGL